MRRPLARHAFTALSLLSLVLCVGVCLLWVRSYRGAEHFWFIYRQGGATLIRTETGDFEYYRSVNGERDRKAKGPVRFEYAGDTLGPPIGGHSAPGSYPRYWRWGPFSFAGTNPPKPLTAEETQKRQALTDSVQRRVNEMLESPDAKVRQAGSVRQAEILAISEASARGGGTSYNWKFVFPAWSAVLVTLLLPATSAWLLLRRRRTRKRLAAGLCPGCGYDLRASPGRL